MWTYFLIWMFAGSILCFTSLFYIKDICNLCKREIEKENKNAFKQMNESQKIVKKKKKIIKKDE